MTKDEIVEKIYNKYDYYPTEETVEIIHKLIHDNFHAFEDVVHYLPPKVEHCIFVLQTAVELNNSGLYKEKYPCIAVMEANDLNYNFVLYLHVQILGGSQISYRPKDRYAAIYTTSPLLAIKTPGM